MSEKLPQTMNAIAIGADGAPDSLHLATCDVPQPQADEILVRIGAAGVNRGDCMQRIGLYPPPPGAPDIMGLEFAGTVVARGDKALSPRATTVPANSSPIISGAPGGGGYRPIRCIQSPRLTPAAPMRTKISSACGCGTSHVARCRLSGAPSAPMAMAFMVWGSFSDICASFHYTCIIRD